MNSAIGQTHLTSQIPLMYRTILLCVYTALLQPIAMMFSKAIRKLSTEFISEFALIFQKVILSAVHRQHVSLHNLQNHSTQTEGWHE